VKPGSAPGPADGYGTVSGLSGATQVVAVVGNPVRHSLSPLILNSAFTASGLDWVCTAFEPGGDAGGAIPAAVRTLGLRGLSVTMPFKEVVAGSVARLTPVAEALGAVNCLRWQDGDLVGDNTDGDGFVDALRAEGFDPHGRRCALVGAGGAGRAVAWALGQAGAADVVVLNRNRERAERAAGLAGPAGRVGEVGPDVQDADLVVNATSLGMGGGTTPGGADRLPIDPSLLHNGHVVTDLIYHPLTTPLLTAAAERGARAINGVGMLVHKAARSFTYWTGEKPPVETMSAAVQAELAARA
jgi:shikimate dehydrogenase